MTEQKLNEMSKDELIKAYQEQESLYCNEGTNNEIINKLKDEISKLQTSNDLLKKDLLKKNSEKQKIEDELVELKKDNNDSIYNSLTSEEKTDMLYDDEREIKALHNDIFQRDKVIEAFKQSQANITEDLINKFDKLLCAKILELSGKLDSFKIQELPKAIQENENPIKEETNQPQTDNISSSVEEKIIKEEEPSLSIKGAFLTFNVYENNRCVIIDNKTGQQTDFTKQILNVRRLTTLSFKQIIPYIKEIISFKKVYIGHKYMELKDIPQQDGSSLLIFQAVEKNEYLQEQQNNNNNESMD